jgi:hypothetical protein
VLALRRRLAELPAQPAEERDTDSVRRHSRFTQMPSVWSVTKPTRS